jgi:SAM-dependent methyltransferase
MLPVRCEGPMTGEMFKAYTEQFLVSILKRGDIVFMEVHLNGERSKRHAQLGRWYILRRAHGFVLPERSRVVHHAGYAHHAEKVGPDVVRLLRDAGLGSGARILDAGCGSGLFGRTLRIEGFAVLGVDASAAMIELARRYEPDAQFEVVRLPTRKPPGNRRSTADVRRRGINRPRAELPGHAC